MPTNTYSYKDIFTCTFPGQQASFTPESGPHSFFHHLPPGNKQPSAISPGKATLLSLLVHGSYVRLTQLPLSGRAHSLGLANQLIMDHLSYQLPAAQSFSQSQRETTHLGRRQTQHCWEPSRHHLEQRMTQTWETVEMRDEKKSSAQ